MLCNNAEYKKMDQDTSLGQLYYIQNEINILYKGKFEPTHFLQHRLKYLWETNTPTYFPRKSVTTMAICVNVIILLHLVVDTLGK
jgi:hypothetical protein